VIAAGLILLAIGSADLARVFLPVARRWIGLLVVGVAILALGAFSGAIGAALLAIVVGAAWVWLAPAGAPVRAGLWPAVALGVLSAGLVAVFPARTDTGLIGQVWQLQTPIGSLSFDHAVILVGATVFLLESANVIVRAALAQQNVQVGRFPHDVSAVAASAESVQPDADGADSGAPADEEGAESRGPEAAPFGDPPALKGGRLIGPLERVMVFALTLAGVYPLLAAILAAKGIVRFPEISRDSAAGNRAEYFLVGSFVSWTVALAAAFLVWWAFATPGP